MHIEFEPYEKITIRNCMYHDTVDNFANAMTLSLSREAGGRIGTLLWAYGILFKHSPFVPTDSMSKEYILGHLMVDNIEFAPMAVFKEEIYYKQYTVAVLDVSSNLILSRIAKWVSENMDTIKGNFDIKKVSTKKAKAK